MSNHKPVAVDFSFLTGFNDGGYATVDDYFYDRSILLKTPLHDADGDKVTLAFVNGQRIAPTESEGPAPDPTNPAHTHIQGEYGTLTVAGDGTFNYQWDLTNPAVEAMIANGGKLVDKFTFKVTDGHGNTDVGYFNVATEAPQHGTSTITFEDAKAPDFPLKPGDIVYINRNPWYLPTELLKNAALDFARSVVVYWTGEKMTTLWN